MNSRKIGNQLGGLVILLWTCTLSLGAASQGMVYKVVYFDALSSKDKSNIQALFQTLKSAEEEEVYTYRLQNFYENDIQFDVVFDWAAKRQIGSDFGKKNGKMAMLSKPQFKFRGFPIESWNCEIENSRNRGDVSHFEEYTLSQDESDVIVLWDQRVDESWEWGGVTPSKGQPIVDMESQFFKEKAREKWEKGYKNEKEYYKGKPPLSRAFLDKLDGVITDETKEILIVYANGKVESEFSCTKIATLVKRSPEEFKITHNYGAFATMLKPINGKYKIVDINYKENYQFFGGYEILIEVGSGGSNEFKGNEFDILKMPLNIVREEGLLEVRNDKLVLTLNVDWLGSECVKAEGKDEDDTQDCDCQYDCLYEKYFYLSIRGLGDETCPLKVPWSDKMKLSFQCEKSGS